MIRYLLDTNVIIALLKSRTSALAERVRSTSPDEVATSSVTAFELYYGAFNSEHRDQNLGNLERLLLEILPFDVVDARHAGEIRARLRMSGRPIGPYDLLIAGQARARNLTLITANKREFERVTDLRVESWA